MADRAWREVLDVNLTGAFNMTRAVLRPMLKARAGRIINMSSVSGQMGNDGQANYSASKAGLIGLTMVTARGRPGRAGGGALGGSPRRPPARPAPGYVPRDSYATLAGSGRPPAA